MMLALRECAAGTDRWRRHFEHPMNEGTEGKPIEILSGKHGGRCPHGQGYAEKQSPKCR